MFLQSVYQRVKRPSKCANVLKRVKQFRHILKLFSLYMQNKCTNCVLVLRNKKTPVDIGFVSCNAACLKPWRWRQNVSPKRWYLPTSLQGVTIQKTNIDIFTSLRTSGSSNNPPLWSEQKSVAQKEKCFSTIKHCYYIKQHKIREEYFCYTSLNLSNGTLIVQPQNPSIPMVPVDSQQLNPISVRWRKNPRNWIPLVWPNVVDCKQTEDLWPQKSELCVMSMHVVSKATLQWIYVL
jgi:hypothetical protein